MKKWLAALLSVLLVAAMLFSFAACSNDTKDDDDDKDEDTVATTVADKEDEGTTTTTAADKEEDNGIVGTWSGSVDYSEMMAASTGMELEVYMDAEIEFKDDGTYVMTLFMEDMVDNLFDAMEDALAEQELDLDEVLEQQGMTREEYAEAAFGTVEDLVTEGEYELDDGELLMDGEEGFTLDGDKITAEMDGIAIEFTKE